MNEFEQFRPRLFLLAYRVLGARADAEDVVQEAYLRWRAADRAGVQSPGPYLNAVVARLSLDALKSARRKRETYVGTWLPEPVALEADPACNAEFSDTLSVAFLHVLETLSPNERVAFLMREVFGEEYADVAAVLETSETNCRQLVARARRHVLSKRPRHRVDPEQHRAVLREFLAACANGDKATLVQLLRADAALYSDGGGKRPAAINPVHGADKVARFFLGIRNKNPGLEIQPLTLGGLPSVMFRVEATGQVDSMLSVDLDSAGRIQAIYVIRNPDKLQGIAG